MASIFRSNGSIKETGYEIFTLELNVIRKFSYLPSMKHKVFCLYQQIQSTDTGLTNLVAYVADLLLATVLSDMAGLVALVAPVLLLPALAGEVAVPAETTDV